ncbi:MAG: prolyl oligopeptidase family serine peptidase [Armatimonadetes bacterium]|nr:prolyl oligopeptidase family serine peptidase [Armatimonadota bacterium]
MSPATNGYCLPPEAILQLIDAPETPHVSLSPDRAHLVLLQPEGLPPIAEVARPELRLAGLRIDPRNHGPSRLSGYTGLTLQRLGDGTQRPLAGLPPARRYAWIAWSPDSTQVAFCAVTDEGIQLCTADLDSAVVRSVTGPVLNASYGMPYTWLPDSSGWVTRQLVPDMPPPPEPPETPLGPNVQESLGRTAPAPTFQDLLRNEHDDALFVWHTTCQLVRVGLDGAATSLGEPGLYRRCEPSPDGSVLLVDRAEPPFSRLVPVHRFAHAIEVWAADAAWTRTIARVPLAEEVPITFDAVPTGPRSVGWRDDAPATLHWVEALDGGDPAVPAEVRDRLCLLAAPFEGDPRALTDLALRCGGVRWGDEGLALIYEGWWKNRHERVWQVAPDEPGAEPNLLFDRSFEDRYSDPGTPLMRPAGNGRHVLHRLDGALLFLGQGASPEGDRPFVDRLDLATGETTRLWRSEAPWFERPVALLDEAGPRLLTVRESPAEPPNYHARDLATGELRPVTTFRHPYPDLRDVRKELIRYPRDDGVQLTATLYTPPGWSPDHGPLPTLLWAYPREFKSADAAGQVTDSPYRFPRISPHGPLPMLTQGWAVLDGPTMPIIGEGDTEANDTYVAQLVASARAAVEELVRRGVGSADRLAVGGHSYGAFMTANLLAHCDLFQAGAARSGAYNRTLTPFGFQAEERTYWQAPEVYAAMSAFMHVDRIKAPVLLLHGEADSNSGTYPMQSERLYNALKGHGATCRLVLLPGESHGYRARESVLHMWWEQTEWLNRFVNDPRP